MIELSRPFRLWLAIRACHWASAFTLFVAPELREPFARAKETGHVG